AGPADPDRLPFPARRGVALLRPHVGWRPAPQPKPSAVALHSRCEPRRRSPRAPLRRSRPSHQRSCRRRFLPIASASGSRLSSTPVFRSLAPRSSRFTPQLPASLGSGKPPTSSVNFGPLSELCSQPVCAFHAEGYGTLPCPTSPCRAYSCVRDSKGQLPGRRGRHGHARVRQLLRQEFYGSIGPLREIAIQRAVYA